MAALVQLTRKDAGGGCVEARLEGGVWTSTETLTEVYLDVVTALWRAADGGGSATGADGEHALARYCADLLGGTVADLGRVEREHHSTFGAGAP